MIKHSTREAAKKLGIHYDTLAHYVAVGKVPAPEIITVGRRIVHMWTDEEIEQIRKLLPKVPDGRKTRWQRQKAQAQSPVPRKSRKKKKTAK